MEYPGRGAVGPRAEARVGRRGRGRAGAAERRRRLPVAPLGDRPEGVRLRAGWRGRSGLAGPRGRRAGHRQVHAAAPVRRPSRGGGHPHALRVGRGIGRAGAAAGRSARSRTRRVRAALAEVRVEAILAAGARHGARECVVVDSIQTMYTDDLEGAPGNVGQVRECAARLMRFAKDAGTRGARRARDPRRRHRRPQDAGARGRHRALLRGRAGRRVPACCGRSRTASARWMRCGVFEMTAQGLRPVAEPVGRVHRRAGTSETAGSAVTALMEGTRPVLVEIQALAAKAGFGTPQRVATGLEHRRLAVLLAVLERRGGLSVSRPRRLRQRDRGHAPDRDRLGSRGRRRARARACAIARVPGRCACSWARSGSAARSGRSRHSSAGWRRRSASDSVARSSPAEAGPRVGLTRSIPVPCQCRRAPRSGSPPDVGVLIAAGGRGERAGGERVPSSSGRSAASPCCSDAIRPFARHPRVGDRRRTPGGVRGAACPPGSRPWPGSGCNSRPAVRPGRTRCAPR